MRSYKTPKGSEGVNQSIRVGKTQGTTNTGDPMGDNKRTWSEMLDQLRAASNDTDNRVVVLLSGDKEGNFNLLNSYGGVRVYDKDHVDPRVTMGGPVPRFSEWDACEKYLLEHPGRRRPCLLAYTEAKKVFSEDWADFTPQPDQ
jgi:hypothetical protein